MLRMTFLKTSKDKILRGEKTETRRLWLPRYAKMVMSVWRTEQPVAATTNRFKRDATFAHIMIRDMYQHPLSRMTHYEVLNEGFPDMTVVGFFNLICDMHRVDHPADRAMLWAEGRLSNGRELYAIRFKIEKEG